LSPLYIDELLLLGEPVKVLNRSVLCRTVRTIQITSRPRSLTTCHCASWKTREAAGMIQFESNVLRRGADGIIPTAISLGVT
jgi:hypothetical protein